MKIICIGRNYAEHARELNNAVPDNPIFFMKPDSALLRNNDPFFYPNFSHDIHYETELVVRINRIGKHIEQRFAHRYYDEVGLGIDFTARDLQNAAKQKGHPWEIAKAFDQSAAISQFVPLASVGEIQNLRITLEKNGTTVQAGITADMLFPVYVLIAYVSQFMTLKIGDLLYTGTPAGVGPVQIGDRLTAKLQGQTMLDFMIK